MPALSEARQKDAIPEVIHVDVRTLVMANRLTLFPDDLTWTQEHPFRNLILSLGEIIRLPTFAERVELWRIARS